MRSAVENVQPSGREWERWVTVVVFAVAMSWVEAACVYYLRLVVGRIEPYQAHPLPMDGPLGSIELVREASTLVMLLAAGILAGRTWLRRLGYGAVAFGVWDIGYYLFLRVICGWPKSLVDWDVLFLLPLPWWGPVAAPLCIAILMIGWGTVITQSFESDPAALATCRSWGVGGLGITLALYVFMVDSLRALNQGMDLREILPTSFNWPLFMVALVMMAIPPARMAWRSRRP